MNLNKIMIICGLRGPRSRIAFFLLFLAYGLWPVASGLYAQTELGSEDDLTVLGVDGTVPDPDTEIKGFTVFGSTNLLTHISTAPGNVVINGALEVSSDVYIVGVASAARFYGDGTGLTGLSGDNLGTHIATQTLNMADFGVVNVASITVANFIRTSTLTVLAPDTLVSSLWVSTSAVTPHLYVSTAGNIGLGTATPSARLRVVGANSLDSSLAAHFSGTTGLGLVVTNTNRVGIGLASPDGSLHARHTTDTTAAIGRFEAAVGGYTGTSLIAENTLSADSTYRLFEAATDSDGDAGGRTVRFVIRGDGNVGIGTAAPGARLEVAGQVKITGGSPGAGKVLTSDAAGLATWGTASGDNLGNHTATQVLQMGAYGVNTSSNITAARYQINGSTVLAILAGADSLGVGVGAGINTSGGGNSFVGYQAGYTNTSGGGNSFVGKYSGYSNTTGSNNVAIGYTAGYFNTSGSNNSFIGNAAGSNITTGEENSFVGKYTGRFNQTGSANAIFGNAAGGGSGSANSFSSSTLAGYRAGYGLTTGSDNILLGWQAGDNLTSGARNILLGYDIDAPAAASSDFLSIGNLIFATGGFGAGTAAGAGNVGIGTAAPGARLEVAGQVKITGGSPGAGKVLTSDAAGLATWGTASGDNLGNHTGTQVLQMGAYGVNTSSNITAARYQINGSTVLAILPGNSLVIGPNAGIDNSGSSNVFAGPYAGYTNTSGYSNTFVGASAGYYNVGGDSNSFFGGIAGLKTTASRNTFMGYAAGYSNTGGADNSFMGYAAGYSNTSGANNSVIGVNAARNNQTGSANAILGNQAGYGSLGSFSSSTLAGYKAGFALTTGSDNILLGWQAGDNLTSGARNILLGYDIDAPAAASSDFLSIGNLIFATGGFGAGTAAGAGNVGIGTAAPGARLEVAGQVKITGGSPGAGKVLTSDAAGLATWGTASGDNLGNHTATQALNMADKAVDNVSSMTVTGTGVTGAESLFSVAGSTLVALNNGNVGIGTNSPGYPLEIKPSGMAGFQVEPQAGYVSLRVNGVEVARLVP